MNGRTIVGSIVRQLLRTNPRVVEAVVDHDMLLNSEDMLYLLCHSIPSEHKIYLVLDGLDLCDDVNKQEVTDFIQKLQKPSTLLLCATYRQEPNLTLESALQKLLSVHAVPLPNNDADIEMFIQRELSTRIETRSLTLGDPTIILDIQDALLRGSQGMFLWVSLQIQSLCTLHTDDEIRDILLHLPQDLSTIHAQVLRRRCGPIAKYRRQIFELIAAAQRPLTVSEIREALSVTPGAATWTAGKLINDVYSALSSCGCLVVIDEEELTVRFVHHSVLQYLFGRYEYVVGEPLSLSSCHRTMAEITATYLCSGVSDTKISAFRVPQLNAGPAPSNIILSTISSSRSAQNFALRLLKLKKDADFDIGRTIARKFLLDERIEAYTFHFRQYAKSHCFDHIMNTTERSPHIEALLPRLLHKDGSLKIELEIDDLFLDSWPKRQGSSRSFFPPC